MDARAGPLADDQIHAKIFHRGIEHLFHGGLQTMNFVEEKNFFRFERRKDGGEVAFALKQRPGAGFDRSVPARWR